MCFAHHLRSICSQASRAKACIAIQLDSFAGAAQRLTPVDYLETYWRKLMGMRPEQALLVFQSTLAAFAITPFGVWRLSRGEWGQGIFDLALVLALFALAWLALSGRWLRSIGFTVAGLYVLSSLF